MNKLKYIFLMFLISNLGISSSYAIVDKIRTSDNVIYISSKKANDKIYNHLKETINNLKIQLHCAQTEINKLQLSKYEQENKLDEFKNRVSYLKKELANFEKLNTNVQKQLDSVQSENEELHSFILNNNTSANNDEFIKKDEAEINLKIKENEIAQLNDKIKIYKMKTKKLYEEVASLNESQNSITDNYVAIETYSKLLAEKNKLQEKNRAMIYKMAKLEEEANKGKLHSLNLVDDFKKENNIEACLCALEKLKKDKENSYLAYYSLGCAYKEKEDYKDAINNFKKSINKNPKFDKSYIELGKAYLFIGEHKKARKTFERCMEHIRDKNLKTDLDEILSNSNRI